MLLWCVLVVYPGRLQSGCGSRFWSQRAGTGTAVIGGRCYPRWTPAWAGTDRPSVHSCPSYCWEPKGEKECETGDEVFCHQSIKIHNQIIYMIWWSNSYGLTNKKMYNRFIYIYKCMYFNLSKFDTCPT